MSWPSPALCHLSVSEALCNAGQTAGGKYRHYSVASRLCRGRPNERKERDKSSDALSSDLFCSSDLCWSSICDLNRVCAVPLNYTILKALKTRMNKYNVYLSLSHVYSTSVCMFICLWGCVFVSCEHLTPFGRTLAEPGSQHDHWSSVTWQIRPWIKKKKTCKRAKEKAQEIEHHPNPLGARNPQDAVSLEDKTEAQRKSYIKKKKRRRWKAFYEYVCVLLNSVWACVILGSGVVAAEVRQQGRMLEFCLAWDGEKHTGQAPGLVDRASGGGCSIQRSSWMWGKKHRGAGKELCFGWAISQRSLWVLEGGAKILNVLFFWLLES